MSEIAIISTKEVTYEPSLQKTGKIKVTSLRVPASSLPGYRDWETDRKSVV